jgi:concanavalin A-like lectin/glucanase superfamily protein
MAWFDNNWLYRFKVTSDQTKVDEAVDNVFYDLANAPAGFWTHVKSDGGDIRVTQSDQVTEVAREISGFNQGSNLGSLFFKATGLSDTLNTDFYIYYGNSAASEPASGASNGKNNVWTSYLCVFHLDEASGNVTDSKGNVTGTNTGVALGSTGKIRTGGSWVDSGDQIDAGDNFDITAASLSISAWVNPTNLASNHTIVQKENGDNKNGYQFFINTSGGITLGVADAGSEHIQASNNSVVATGSLQFAFVTYDGANVRFYVNGTAQGAPAETIIPTNATQNFGIGNFVGFDFGRMVGILDEVRVSTSVRSANWITTEFNDQNAPNTFWTTGTEENVPAPPSTSLPFITILDAKRI